MLNNDRVVYLDSDLIVNGNLDSLFEFDMNNHHIACSLDIDANDGTFNTGVIVYETNCQTKCNGSSKNTSHGVS